MTQGRAIADDGYMDLAERIRHHEYGVVGLRAQLDATLAGIEAETEQAKEQLHEYQRMKAESESRLDRAGGCYAQAERLLRAAGGLAARLKELQRQQRRTERLALGVETEMEPTEIQAACQSLAELRFELGKMKAEIQVLRMSRAKGALKNQAELVGS